MKRKNFIYSLLWTIIFIFMFILAICVIVKRAKGEW